MHADRKTANLTPEQLEKRRKQLAYVRQYHDLAEHEMEKNGIPVSITLAQGLLESNIERRRNQLEQRLELPRSDLLDDQKALNRRLKKDQQGH